jgi:hypothetical protein
MPPPTTRMVSLVATTCVMDFPPSSRNGAANRPGASPTACAAFFCGRGFDRSPYISEHSKIPAFISPRYIPDGGEHGKSVLPSKTRLGTCSWVRVTGHTQVIEDTANIVCQLVDGGGDAIGAFGLDETAGKATQPCDGLRPWPVRMVQRSSSQFQSRVE